MSIDWRLAAAIVAFHGRIAANTSLQADARSDRRSTQPLGALSVPGVKDFTLGGICRS